MSETVRRNWKEGKVGSFELIGWIYWASGPIFLVLHKRMDRTGWGLSIQLLGFLQGVSEVIFTLEFNNPNKIKVFLI